MEIFLLLSEKVSFTLVFYMRRFYFSVKESEESLPHGRGSIILLDNDQWIGHNPMNRGLGQYPKYFISLNGTSADLTEVVAFQEFDFEGAGPPYIYRLELDIRQ